MVSDCTAHTLAGQGGDERSPGFPPSCEVLFSSLLVTFHVSASGVFCGCRSEREYGTKEDGGRKVGVGSEGLEARLQLPGEQSPYERGTVGALFPLPSFSM